MTYMNALVEQVQDLWYEGYSVGEISKILNVETHLIGDALDVIEDERCIVLH